MTQILLFDFFNTLYFPQHLREPLNQELIEFVRQHASQHPSYIFTSAAPIFLERQRSKLVPPFIDLFSSKKIGSKNDPQSYLQLADQLQLTPAEIIFVDDSETKLAAATAAGLTPVHYTANDQVIRQLTQLLS